MNLDEELRAASVKRMELESEVKRLQAAIGTVDDVLVVNWVAPPDDGNYRLALNQLMGWGSEVDKYFAAEEGKVATLEDKQKWLAAYARQVAARVLKREAQEWRATGDLAHMAYAAECLDIAAEYESGEREVPNA